MLEKARRSDARNARRRKRYAQDPMYRAKVKRQSNERSRAYRQAHKEEINARARARYQAHKHEINERCRARYHASDNASSKRRAHLKRYGISPAEYNALLAKQNGACAICRRRSKGRLCVDHCHMTGMIRGLLCDSCNLGLGSLKEDQASLVAALAYLGALPRDGPGSAAERALAVHGALPPWPTRRAVLTYPPVGCDAAPPAGGNTRSPIREALDAELVRAGDGEGHNVLQLIARRLASKALEGDLGAIREIFDRMDGKAGAGAAPHASHSISHARSKMI